MKEEAAAALANISCGDDSLKQRIAGISGALPALTLVLMGSGNPAAAQGAAGALRSDATVDDSLRQRLGVHMHAPATSQVRGCMALDQAAAASSQQAGVSASASAAAPAACAACGRSAGEGGRKLRKCKGCRSVAYCSTDCQKTHWRRHKAACQAAQAAGAK